MLEKVLLLRSVELLRDVELDELRQIADDAVVRCFEDGQHVFTFGDAGTDMYVVTDGTVALEQEVGGTGDVRRVATVGPRGYFGETAMFHDEPRTAQAVAVGRVELLQLDRETVLRLGRRRPEVLVNIVRVLSERLRQADADLG
jgi:CRP-like cAMP-binding protein